jgi:hypothetical protein
MLLVDSGPTPWALIGNLKDLNPMGPNLTKMSKIYGPIFPVYFGSALKWIISDAAFVAPLLQRKLDTRGDTHHYAVHIQTSFVFQLL